MDKPTCLDAAVCSFEGAWGAALGNGTFAERAAAMRQHMPARHCRPRQSRRS